MLPLELGGWRDQWAELVWGWRPTTLRWTCWLWPGVVWACRWVVKAPAAARGCGGEGFELWVGGCTGGVKGRCWGWFPASRLACRIGGAHAEFANGTQSGMAASYLNENEILPMDILFLRVTQNASRWCHCCFLYCFRRCLHDSRPRHLQESEKVSHGFLCTLSSLNLIPFYFPIRFLRKSNNNNNKNNESVVLT